MAAWTYNESLRRLLADEGGYSNLAADPGGPTNFGITIYDYRKYINSAGTAADVKAMTVKQAKAIYKSKYWDAMRCDDLPAGVDYAVFDYGVNSGIGRSGKVLRKLLGWPTNTSVITGEVVVAAAKRDPKALIMAIYDERLAFLKSLKTWPTFGKGWRRRCIEGEAAALSLAAKKVDPIPQVPGPAAPGKGKIPQPDTTVITHGAPAVTATAVAGFWGWVSAHPVLTTLVLAGLLAGILVTLNAIKAARVKTQETPPADLKPVPVIVKEAIA